MNVVERIGRRGFLGRAGAVLSALLLPGARWPRSPWWRPTRDLDPVQLHAVAEAALPGYLGTAGRSRVVDGFQAWLDGYRPGAERSHGYGSMAIGHLPPDPAPRWQGQLEELDGAARQRGGVSFAELALEDRRVVLRERLAAARSPGLSSPQEADHVAAALMAFHFHSADASDRAYGGVIGKESCRPLATAGERPAPFPSGGGAA